MLDKAGPEEAAQRRKASVRAKVEHPFLYVKRLGRDFHVLAERRPQRERTRPVVRFGHRLEARLRRHRRMAGLLQRGSHRQHSPVRGAQRPCLGARTFERRESRHRPTPRGLKGQLPQVLAPVHTIATAVTVAMATVSCQSWTMVYCRYLR